jgi:SAM-dependent methyltransferase
MAHLEQQIFVERVKQKYPEYFTGVKVLDCGSLDINGNNRIHFHISDYLGIDLHQGRNVDRVCRVHEFKGGNFDVVISTEMLEHDKFWKESLAAMYSLLRDDGLLVITAATTGREEHGTYRHHWDASPGTLDYYENITKEMLESVLARDMFSDYCIEIRKTDIYFYGIKCDLCSRLRGVSKRV